MVFDGFLRKLKDGSTGSNAEYVELDTEKMDAEGSGHALIRIEAMEDFADSEKVQRLVREGHIVFAKITGLKNKDMSELKRAVEKIKKTCMAVGGDIAGVDEDWVIITPSYAKVHRDEVVADGTGQN